jgi:hypothetical protein
MPFSIRKLTSLQFVAFCLMALLGLSAFAFSWSDWFAKSKSDSAVSLTAVQAGPPEVYSGLLIQELLTLRATGFDPAEITIPSGNFLLSVDNLSGISTINLALAEEKKNKLKDIKIEGKNRDWREVINLKTGVYILSETNNPKWTCRITVTDKVRAK